MLFQRQINLHTTVTELLRIAVRNQDLGGEVGCFTFNFPRYYFAGSMKEFSLNFFILSNCQGKDLLRTSQLRHEDCDRP